MINEKTLRLPVTWMAIGTFVIALGISVAICRHIARRRGWSVGALFSTPDPDRPATFSAGAPAFMCIVPLGSTLAWDYVYSTQCSKLLAGGKWNQDAGQSFISACGDATSHRSQCAVMTDCMAQDIHAEYIDGNHVRDVRLAFEECVKDLGLDPYVWSW